MTVRAPVSAPQVTANDTVAVCEAVMVTLSGFSPSTAQLPAMPPSVTACAPAVSPSTVRVSLDPMASAAPPSTRTV